MSWLDHVLLAIAELRRWCETTFAERDLRYQQRFEAQEKALVTAVTAIDNRLTLLNELRVGVATVAQIEALQTLFNDLSGRLKLIEGRSAGTKDGLGYVVGGIATVVAVVSLIASLVIK